MVLKKLVFDPDLEFFRSVSIPRKLIYLYQKLDFMAIFIRSLLNIQSPLQNDNGIFQNEVKEAPFLFSFFRKFTLGINSEINFPVQC